MDDPRALLGFVLLVGGAVGARYAHVLAKWDEQLDSIGSTRSWDAVEPATWKVTFVLLAGVVGFLVGAFLLVSGLL